MDFYRDREYIVRRIETIKPEGGREGGRDVRCITKKNSLEKKKKKEKKSSSKVISILNPYNLSISNQLIPA